jgi:cyclase
MLSIAVGFLIIILIGGADMPAVLMLNSYSGWAGEIVTNTINNDGMMKGYNFDLINHMFKHITIPATILGCAGTDLDLKYVYKKYRNIAYSCGGLFIYKGNRKAVLVNYPVKKLNLLNYYKE